MGILSLRSLDCLLTTKLIGFRELSSLSCGLLALIFALHLRDVPGWRMPPLLLVPSRLGLPLIYLIHSLLHKSISLLSSHLLNVTFLPSRTSRFRLHPQLLLLHHHQILLSLLLELCFKLSSVFLFLIYAFIFDLSVSDRWLCLPLGIGSSTPVHLAIHVLALRLILLRRKVLALELVENVH